MQEYCKGKHKCRICKKKYNCNGEEISHTGSAGGSGRCHGEYEQFCPNHTMKEYRKKHKELGEL